MSPQIKEKRKIHLMRARNDILFLITLEKNSFRPKNNAIDLK